MTGNEALQEGLQHVPLPTGATGALPWEIGAEYPIRRYFYGPEQNAGGVRIKIAGYQLSNGTVDDRFVYLDAGTAGGSELYPSDLDRLAIIVQTLGRQLRAEGVLR